ncbi:UNVERIFIED_CONTAM: hypothetical protein GTU68_019826 [Idotea baltica]|nr:hypothetical protein [Idotea baltica]
MTRVALVTGGTRGIGEAISTSLQDSGHTVVANYAGNDDNANAFSERTGIQVCKFDVGDFDAVKSQIGKLQEEHGAIEILVNNAGITRDGTMHKMQAEQWIDVIRTNLGSCFYVSRCVIEGMRERKFGRIVNIGSIKRLQCGALKFERSSQRYATGLAQMNSALFHGLYYKCRLAQEWRPPK